MEDYNVDEIKGMFYDTLSRLDSAGYLRDGLRNQVTAFMDRLLEYKLDKEVVSCILDIIGDSCRGIEESRQEVMSRLKENESGVIINLNNLVDELKAHQEERIHIVRKSGGMIVLELSQKVKK